MLQNDWIKPDKRIFNNKQISDHFAIIPTNAPAKSLNADEAKLFDMIARRFIAIFFPPAEFDVTTRLSVAAEHTFKTEGKVLAVPGWLSIYGKGAQGADNLPALSASDSEPASAKIVFSRPQTGSNQTASTLFRGNLTFRDGRCRKTPR